MENPEYLTKKSLDFSLNACAGLFYIPKTGLEK